jgi:hypothetical protein
MLAHEISILWAPTLIKGEIEKLSGQYLGLIYDE